jgi:hypothetical protein
MIPSGKDTHVFSGVMDTDTEARYMNGANYRYLLNARSAINTQGSFGAIEDVMGNVIVNNPYLQNGTNKVIGSYEDIEGQSCIYFVWNSLGYHGIFRWYLQTNTIEKIYQVRDPLVYDVYFNNPLDFKENNLITGVSLASDNLYWTDYNAQPKSISIADFTDANKNQLWNFYVYQENLFYDTEYNILYGLASAPIAISFVTNQGQSLGQRLVAIANSLNTQPTLKATVKTNYIQIEVLNGGQYSFDIKEYRLNPFLNTPKKLSRIIPVNFVANYQTFTPQFNISEWFTNNIKTPPWCHLDAEYGTYVISGMPTASTLLSQWAYTAAPSIDFNPTSPPPYVLALGFSSQDIVSDPNNILTPGAPSQGFAYGGSPNVVAPNAFFKFDYAQVYNLKVDIDMTVNIFDTFGNLCDQQYQVVINLRRYTVNREIIASWVSPIYFQDTQAQPPTPVVPVIKEEFDLGFTPLVDPSAVYFLDIEIVYVPSPAFPTGLTKVTFNSGSVFITSSNYLSKIDQRVPYIFRAKYIFKNYQHSVYSAYSATPQSFIQNKENAIKISFSDKYLLDDYYAGQIKNVVLCYSEDNGLTWHDIKLLQPYEFIPEQIYYFTGNESLNTVPASEAALQYHAIPLKAKSQEYIGERLWYGGMIEGYDLVDVNATFNAKYEDVNLLSTYPDLNTYNKVLESGKIGAFWERGYEGYIGIVYADDYDRKTFVNLSNDSYIRTNFWSQDASGLAGDFNYVPMIDWEIYNAPPDWATKYYFVRTPNMITENFLEWVPLVNYVDANYNIVPTVATAKYFQYDYANLADYAEKSGANINFEFGEGDYILWKSKPYYAFRISGVVGNLVYTELAPVTIPAYQTLSLPVGANYWIYIYSPSKTKDKPYYEFACYDILTVNGPNGLVKVHAGPTNNQNATFNFPARGTFGYGQGNVWYRGSSLGTSIATNDIVQRLTINDFTTVVSNNNGRPNTISDLGQQDKSSMVRFSDRYIDIESDGNNAFQPLNYKQYDVYFGLINKMQVINNDIIRAVFNNSVQLSIYVNQGILRQGQGGTNIVSLSDSVIGDDHLLQRTLGTKNGESVCISDEADCFGYDENEGVVWVTQSNGLLQISDKGMKSIFKQYSNQRKATGGISETPCVYDLYHDEYILTLGTVKGSPMIPPNLVIDNIADLGVNYNQVPFDLKLLPQPPGPWYYFGNAFYPEIWKLLNSVLVNGGWGYTITHTPDPLGGPDIITITAPNYNDYVNKQLQITIGNNVYVYTFIGGQPAVNDIPGVTIAYNKQKQGWTSYYSFVPEYYGRVRDAVVSFVNGQLWRHDVSSIAKNFYGVQYTRDLTFVSNKDFPKVKQYKAIQVNGVGQNDCPSITIQPYEGVPTGMQSSLSKRFFQTLEGLQYAHFQKDKLSPGFGGNQLQALVNGRNLKGQTIEVTLQNNDNVKSSIFSTDIVYFYSENS